MEMGQPITINGMRTTVHCVEDHAFTAELPDVRLPLWWSANWTILPRTLKRFMTMWPKHGVLSGTATLRQIFSQTTTGRMFDLIDSTVEQQQTITHDIPFFVAWLHSIARTKTSTARGACGFAKAELQNLPCQAHHD